MLVLFIIFFSGIALGRLLLGCRLDFMQRLITCTIWLLLFLLGVEVGSDPEVIGGLTTLGRAAFLIFAAAVTGSTALSWGLWRLIRRRTILAGDDEGEEKSDHSVWRALRGSLIIIGFFIIGIFVAQLALFDLSQTRLSTYVLYTLMFCIGVTLGNDRTIFIRVRQLDLRLALLPLATLVGTLFGAAAVVPLLGGWSITDSLAVGSGFGYYSLSSLFIADMRGAELATIALLCNVMREIFTLLAAPLVARWFGPLAAVSIGGATSFDTTLPIITQSAGRPYAVVAIFHGCMLDFCVPVLVTFFCSI